MSTARPVLTVACQWCRRTIGYRSCEPAQDGKVSHGVCRKCWDRHCFLIPITPDLEVEWARLEASLKEFQV